MVEYLALAAICGLAASAAADIWHSDMFQRWREPLRTKLEQYYLGAHVPYWWLLKAILCPFCLTFHLTALFLVAVFLCNWAIWPLLWLAGGRIGVAAGRFPPPRPPEEPEL